MTAVEVIRFVVQKQKLGPGNWALFEVVCNGELGEFVPVVVRRLVLLSGALKDPHLIACRGLNCSWDGLHT